MMRPLESTPYRFSQRRPRFRRRLSHTANILVINLLAIASLVAGAWFSLLSGDWQWFSRSGSLLVVLGILLTSSQIIENGRRIRMRRQQHASHFKHDYADDLDRHRLDHASIHEEDLWHDGLRGLKLLVVGTLVWGFGDLAGYLLIG